MPRLQAVPAAANVGNGNSNTDTSDQEPSATSLSRDRAFLLSNVEIGGQIQTAVQQVHISEDEAELGDESAYVQKRIDLLSEMSGSGNSVCVDFAGFPSPGNTLLNVTPYGSKGSLQPGDVSAVDVGTKTRTAVIKAHKRSGNSHTEETPVKRHKEQHRRLAAREHLQTNIDQIFEIDSNSTSKSQKEKRLKLQKSLNQSSQQKQQTPNTNNRRSTETSSEFPVSSPSNPLAGRGNKYTKRPPLLKNTLPADAFERNLALITSRNPQMSLAEKMNAWQCDTELSDVEDVNNFDDLFKKYDEQKRKFIRAKHKNKEGQDAGTPISSVNLVEESPDKYDFLQFRTRMRNLAHARKEANKLKEYDLDKPTTSAAAVIHAGLRRPKANTVNTNASTYNSISAESRKRAQQFKKVGKNSTTPPSTSSSERDVRDNDDEAAQHVNHCYPSPKKKPHLQSPPSPEVLVYDKVHCASSSEETSQDASHAKPRYLRSNTTIGGSRQLRPSATAMSPVQRGARISMSATAAASNMPILPSLLVHCAGNTDEESVFRRHRPNREIDKETLTFKGIAEEQQGLIQMRLDFLNEKKDLHLKERARELFKTPIVPQKYTSPTTTAAGENHQQQQQHELYHMPNKHNGHNDVNDFSTLLPANQLSKSPTFVTEQLKVSAVDVGSSFHQQHEFCNYLGLTGMSTAHAVANAVAELAKCNMTRRSLRVQRLQQLEKRERTEKNNNNDDDERKGLEALKLKQLRELKRRMNLGKQVATSASSIEATTVALQQQHYMSPPPPDSQFSVASTSAAASVNLKTEPEIKILCQISSTNKEEAEIVSRNYAKQLVAPIRQTLLRHLKSKRAAAGNLSSNGNSTCPRSLHSDDEQLKAKRRAPSARQRLLQHGRRERDKHTPQADIKSEPAPSCRSVQRQSPQCSESTNKLIKVRDQQQMREDLCQESVENHARMQLLRDKFQKCLEASRQTKPSIFIVKSMASGAITKPCNEPKRLQAGTTAKELQTLQTYNSTIKAANATTSNLTSETLLVGHSTTTIVKSSKLSKRRKNFEQLATGAVGLQSLRSQGRLHKLITRSGSNMRQLRSRKIYIVKAKKRSKACKVGQQSAEKVDKATLTCGTNNSPKVETLLQNAALATTAPAKTSIAPADAAMHELFGFKTKMNSAVNTDFVLPMPTTHTAEIIAPRSMRSSLNANASYQSPLRKIHTDILQRLTEPSEMDAMGEAADAELSKALEPESELEQTNNTSSRPTQTALENETVVVSSTTNTYDENMLRSSGSNNNNVSRNSISQLPLTLTKDIYKNCTFLVESQELLQHQHPHPLVTQDSATQCYAMTPPAPRRAGGTEAGSIHYLAAPARTLQNPLQRKNGQVLYVYYELDVLIVVQELLVSFWKYSKLMNVLTPNNQQLHSTAIKPSQTSFGNSSGGIAGGDTQTEGDVGDISGEWLGLGDCRRLVNDIEIATPYPNRMCMHNSMPLYLEMRCRELTHERRDCNLLSMYINIYYYHDDELHAKTHSIQLDTVQSLSSNVIYTAIPESRYFVMSWPQENILGRIRSGLCKYSLTPQLDTLASIREFKSMRHELLYLECTVGKLATTAPRLTIEGLEWKDDKLLGFGATQLTIWDHRSGDVLMNYDFDLPLGRNLGSIYFPSVEIGQNNMILLFQYVQHNDEADGVLMLPEPPEMLVIACSISHTTPSHRVLQRQQLPQPAFDVIKSAINTGEHLLITAQSDDEIWISCTDPSIITCVAPQHTQRFYSRGRTQLIELTDSTLMVDSFANHVLKLAAATPTHEIILSTRASAEPQPQVI